MGSEMCIRDSTISARNAAGTELMYNYEQIFDAENGHSLVLTLDANVQMSLENGLESMLKKYGAKNGGTGIVMDVNSGAIVAMASYPNYDLNDYGTIFDDALKTKLDTELAKIDANRSTYESEEAYAGARSAAINSAVQSQWRNKCIDSTYEPGSTYKPITLAAALEESCGHIDEDTARLTKLRDKLIAGLSKIPHSALNGDPVHRLPTNVNFCFEGIEGESLLLLLDQVGICASSGSACTSGSLDPSHVLLAIGRPHEVAHGSLRLSLCHDTTEEQVDYILEKVPGIVAYLRDMSPMWKDLESGKRTFIL